MMIRRRDRAGSRDQHVVARHARTRGDLHDQFLTVFGTSTTNVYVGGADGVVMVGTQ